MMVVMGLVDWQVWGVETGIFGFFGKFAVLFLWHDLEHVLRGRSIGWHTVGEGGC